MSKCSVGNIHCIVSEQAKKKIKEYGKGSITIGILRLLELAESKKIVIVINTEVNLDDV